MSNNHINYDFYDDAIIAAPGKALSDAIAANTVLKELNLANNYLKPAFMKEFAVGLSANGAMASLDLRFNSFRTDQQTNLRRICASKNTALKL